MSEGDSLNIFSVESWLLAREMPKGINKCDSCRRPESDVTLGGKSSGIHTVLGARSRYVKCFMGNRMETWKTSLPVHLSITRASSNCVRNEQNDCWGTSYVFSCMTVRDEIPERRRRLRAHWWEMQTWRRGRGSWAAAWGSCTSPSTTRTSRRCSPTEPWPPRSGSGLLVKKKERSSFHLETVVLEGSLLLIFIPTGHRLSKQTYENDSDWSFLRWLSKTSGSAIQPFSKGKKNAPTIDNLKFTVSGIDWFIGGFIAVSQMWLLNSAAQKIQPA